MTPLSLKQQQNVWIPEAWGEEKCGQEKWLPSVILKKAKYVTAFYYVRLSWLCVIKYTK